MTVSVLKALGLYTAPNQLSEVPAGALHTADNVVITKRGVIESRRGQSRTGGAFGASGSVANTFAFYGGSGGHVVHYGTTSLTYATTAGGSYTAYAGSYSAPGFGVNNIRMKFAQANGNLYFNTTTGTKCITALATEPVAAGIPRALDPSIVSGLAGYAVGADAQVGFRVVWGIKDVNNNVKLGAPSGRVVLANATGAGFIATVTIPIPAGITTSHFYRVYQTVDSADANTDPGDECFQSYSAVSPGTSGTFTISVNQPQALLGDPLPTNPKTGDGILSANEQPPLSDDLCFWNGRMWWGATTQKHRLAVEMLGVGSPNGVQEDDTITIAGVAYRAKAIPVVAATDFLLTAGGTPEANVEATTKSLINLINTSGSNTLVYAYYASGENEATGKFLVEARTVGAASFSVAFSRSASWNAVSGTSDNSEAPHGLAYSKFAEPEAVPLVNYLYVGEKSAGILRLVPLRDRLYVFKEDGIYIVSGDAPGLRVDLLDGTVRLMVADSAVPVSNQVYALTNQGVVAVSEGGVAIVSKPVDDLVASFTGNSVFGCSYESERMYLLGNTSRMLVFNTSNNAWTSWPITRKFAAVDPSSDKLVLAESQAIAGSENLYYEVKSGVGRANYQDTPVSVTINSVAGSVLTLASVTGISVGDRISRLGTQATITAVGVGTVTVANQISGSFSAGSASVFTGIPVAIEWAPFVGESPATTKQFREATLHFGKLDVYSFNATFRTELATSATSAPLSVLAYNASVEHSEMMNKRLLVPKEKQRGSLCRVGLTIREALADWSLYGYSLEVGPGSERNGR